MSPRTALPLRLEYIILGLVRRKPVYGYELLQSWNKPEGLSIIWRVKPGTFYAALEKLENMGFLRSSMVPGDASPMRKEYRITSAGEESFEEWYRKPVPTARDFRQDFLVKLYFRKEIDSELMNSVITEQIMVTKKWLSSLTRQYDTSSDFQREVVSFRIQQVKGIIDWLENLPKSINNYSKE